MDRCAHRRLVDNALLEVALNLLQHRRVEHLAQHADRVCAIELLWRVHVLCQAVDHDHDLWRIWHQLLHAEVHHAAKVDIAVAEELCH